MIPTNWTREKDVSPTLTEDWLASQTFLDEFNLSLHRAVAEKLCQNPNAVLKIACDNLTRWLSSTSFEGSGRAALLEWAELVADTSIEKISRTITQGTDEGQCLRSSSPFVGVLSAQERLEIWKII